MRAKLLLAALLISLAWPVGAGEPILGLKKGERVILYDNAGRRTGTLENRGNGVLQFRDTNNRRTGFIRRDGTTYNNDRRRTGKWRSK